MALNLGRFLHSNNGKILMSILLGFGLASLFRKVCKGNNCINFYAPKLEDFNEKIYKINGKCVKYNSYISNCVKEKKIINFE